jgi:hypothetical protein
VRTLQEQLVSLSATQVGARYVFGGDADQTAPYTLDLLNPDVGGGVVQANSAQATRQIQDPLGNTFGVDRTAQQIFDHQNPPGTPAPDNVFTAVNQLRVALTANDIPGIQNAMAALNSGGRLSEPAARILWSVAESHRRRHRFVPKDGLEFPVGAERQAGRRSGASYSGSESSQDAGAGDADGPRADAQDESV